MKFLITGLTALALAVPASGAFAQGAAENTYGGSGQVPAVVGVTEVLGVEETGGGTALGGEAGAPTQSGVAGVQGGEAPSSGSAPVAAATPTESAPGGSLPFTGLDIALIALGGIALLGLGLVMRRFGRPVADV